MDFIQPLFLTTPVLAQWAHVQSGHGNRDGSYAWAQYHGLPLNKADLPSTIAESQPANGWNQFGIIPWEDQLATWWHIDYIGPILSWKRLWFILVGIGIYFTMDLPYYSAVMASYYINLAKPDLFPEFPSMHVSMLGFTTRKVCVRFGRGKWITSHFWSEGQYRASTITAHACYCSPCSCGTTAWAWSSSSSYRISTSVPLSPGPGANASLWWRASAIQQATCIIKIGSSERQTQFYFVLCLLHFLSIFLSRLLVL